MSRLSSGSIGLAIVLASLTWGTSGCRKSGSVATDAASPPGKIASELKTNGLAQLPGAVYRSQADSPIHWQPWTKETLDHAVAANRLVFAVVAMPQQAAFRAVLKNLAQDSALVSLINETYVPVMIDGDAAREIGILTADLCAEIKVPLQLPLFLWMSPEGNPVAWVPVTSEARVAEFFNQSHTMVSRMWIDDTQYVIANSALDNSNRRARLASRRNTAVMSHQPGEDAVRGIRQLASFYDPYSRTFDEAGGLFPAGALDLFATTAVHPGVPADLRTRCLETTRELLLDLLPSAMFDPLEGGVFSSRRGKSWSLPLFTRDCVAQSRAAVALIHAYRATDNQAALDKALGLIDFAEKSYTTPEGLFSVGMVHATDPAAWLWSIEEIEKELPAADGAWWIAATGMKGLGNLPSETDPHREFFRSNSLGLKKSLAQIAAAQAQPLELFRPRFETVRKTLLKARNSRLGPLDRDDSSHAGASFRMVSAYAAAFGATGDVAFREKAVDLLEKSRSAFGEGSRLRTFSKAAPGSVGAGRAFVYALALQAALDVAMITSDDAWLRWSEDLATTAAELFTDAEFLKECPDDAKVIDLPVTDLVMLFDDSTAGLISLVETRLAGCKRPLVASFSQLATPLPRYAIERPILHTDLLQATVARHFNVTLVIGPEVSPDLRLAIERLPLRMIQRRSAKSEDAVPAEAVKILFANDEPRVVSTVEALKQALSSSPN
ncbi:MAG: DUF255 domain-containing protein [Akkermansiaceae bacterium]